MIPCSPRITASTSGESVTFTTTTSERSATSRGEAERVAPAASTSSKRALALRFQAVTGKPAPITFSAIGRPMMPSPTQPTRNASPSLIASPPFRPARPRHDCAGRGGAWLYASVYSSTARDCRSIAGFARLGFPLPLDERGQHLHQLGVALTV